MNIFNRMSIKKKIKLISIFFILVGFTGTLISLFYYSVSFSFYRVNKEFYNLTLEFSILNNLQKDYFTLLDSYDKPDERFDPKNTDTLEYHIKKIENQLNSLREEPMLVIFRLKPDLLLTIENFDKYKTVIRKIFKVNSEIGYGEMSILHSLKQAKARINQSLSVYQFKSIANDFIIIEKLEKIFLRKKQKEDFDLVMRKTDILLKRLRSIKSDDAFIKYQTNKLMDEIAEYQSIFSLLAQKEIELGFGETRGLKGQANDNIMLINNNLHRVLNEFHRNAMQRRNLGIISQIIIFFLFTITIFIILLYTLKSITRPLTKFRNFMDDLLLGKMPDAIEIKTKDEISEIAESLNKYVSSLKEKMDFISKIGEGKLDSELKVLSEHDLFGISLEKMRKNLLEAREEERKRMEQDEIQDWLNEGLAQFGDILRSNNDNIENLSKNVISNLIDYVNAVIGGIYIEEKDEEGRIVYTLKAAFAYNTQKYIKKAFLPGEGLIGAAAAEKRTYYLEKLPDDYVKVTSAYGEAKPKSLIVVPLIVNEHVYGVLELASFDKFKKHEIDFIEKLAEDIATTILYVRINARTAEMLKKSEIDLDEMKEKLDILEKELELTDNEKYKLEEENEKLKYKIQSLEETKAYLEQKIYKLQQELKNKNKD